MAHPVKLPGHVLSKLEGAIDQASVDEALPVKFYLDCGEKGHFRVVVSQDKLAPTQRAITN